MSQSNMLDPLIPLCVGRVAEPEGKGRAWNDGTGVGEAVLMFTRSVLVWAPSPWYRFLSCSELG